MFTDPAKLKTARGITRPDLNRLDAARKVLVEFQEILIGVISERGTVGIPRHVVMEVQLAIATLVSEPVN